MIRQKKYAMEGNCGFVIVVELQVVNWRLLGRRHKVVFHSRVPYFAALCCPGENFPEGPFHPCVTAVAHKRPWSFCQKCRWQVTPKRAYTLDPMKSEWADYATVQT